MQIINQPRSKSDTFKTFRTTSLRLFPAIDFNKDNVKLSLFSFLDKSRVLWSVQCNYVWQVNLQIRFLFCFLFVSLPITATNSASNLDLAAPAYQIPPTLIESDCRGPPRPPLSPQGLCKCVCARKLRVYGRVLERLGGISLWLSFQRATWGAKSPTMV